MGKTATSIVKQRQDPLRERYRGVPGEALVTDCARTIDDRGDDPFHGSVMLGERLSDQWGFGIHGAVGGDHDLPTPGDMLCAALASCLDATIRMVADRLDIGIEALEVAVSAEVDVRGALLVDPGVPVGFQHMSCRLSLRPGDDADPAKLRMLLAATDYTSVVLQTLRKGIPIEARVVTPSRDPVKRSRHGPNTWAIRQ
jgi:uncharacterized OsmC-like protein